MTEITRSDEQAGPMTLFEMVKELAEAGLECRNTLAAISRAGTYDNNGETGARLGGAVGSFDAASDNWGAILQSFRDEGLTV